MSLEDFYMVLEKIESDRFNWRKENQLFNSIQKLSRQLAPSSTLERNSLESHIVRYLLQELRENSSNLLTVAHWYTFLSRRSARVVDKILLSIPTNLLERECLYEMTYSLVYKNLNENKERVYKNLNENEKRKYLLINFFEQFNEKFTENICPVLKSWTDRKIKNILIDDLRITLETPTIGRTNLGLVTCYGKTRVRKALIGAGYSKKILNQYLLIYQCFEEVYNSLNLVINHWKNEQFQQVIERYHQLQPTSALDVEKLKEILEQKIGSSIRQFLNRHLPNQLKNNYICEENGEVLDFREIILVAQSDKVEQEKQWVKIEKFIDDFVSKLSDRDRELLNLSYRKKMGQEQIAQILSVDQATICRKLKKLNTEIFSRVFNLIQNNSLVSNCPTSPSSEQLKAIKEYLKSYYDNLNEE